MSSLHGHVYVDSYNAYDGGADIQRIPYLRKLCAIVANQDLRALPRCLQSSPSAVVPMP